MGKSARSTWKWFDSLLWLGIAGALTALLVPAAREQVVCKTTAENGGNLATEVDAAGTTRDVLPSAYYVNDSVQYFPTRHEFILENEADHLSGSAAEPADATVNGPLLAPPRQD